MARYKIANTSPHDIVVDVKGRNNPRDKKILSPKVVLEVDINNRGLAAIRGNINIKLREVLA